MRLAVVLAVLAITAPAALGAVEKGTFSPGVGGAGITLGMTRAQVVAKLGRPLYQNANGYLQYARVNLFDVYLDPSGRVRLIGISGPAFCTSFRACVGARRGIAQLRARYGSALRLTKLPETGEKEWILLGKRAGRRVFTSFTPGSTKASAPFIQVFIGYGNGT